MEAMKKKKTSRIIAVCMATVLLIGSVGCSSAEEGARASVPGGSEQASSLSTDGAQNEKPTDQNDQIVIAGYRDPGRGTKDPYYTNVNLYVWEPLIGETDQGEPEPRLATSWDRNEDATVWTFHLREGVQFSDGVPFNADAVLKNFERYRNMGVVSSTFFAFCLSRLVLEEVENGAFLCLPQKDGYAFFDNAGFLRRYLLLRISQELRMIQTDIRDDTQDRSDNVRTVQTTAKPDLDNRVIYLLVAEILKSHAGRQLEERRMERLEERTMTLDEIDHVILGDLFPVHPDAFPEVH